MMRRMMLAALNNNRYIVTSQVAAINSRATTEGFSLPPLSVQHQMGILINELISDGVWTKLDCFFNYAFNQTGLGSYTRINWCNPTGILADNFGGLNFTNQGVEGDGSTAYILTNYNVTLSTKASQNVFAKGLAVYKASVISPNIMGTREGGQNITNANSDVQRVNANTSLAANVRDLSGTGMIATHRSSSTVIRVFKGASYKSNTNQTSSATNATRLITFLRAVAGYSDAGIGMGYLGANLTDTEFNSLVAAYNVYLTSIGLTAYA